MSIFKHKINIILVLLLKTLNIFFYVYGFKENNEIATLILFACVLLRS